MGWCVSLFDSLYSSLLTPTSAKPEVLPLDPQRGHQGGKAEVCWRYIQSHLLGQGRQGFQRRVAQGYGHLDAAQSAPRDCS